MSLLLSLSLAVLATLSSSSSPAIAFVTRPPRGAPAPHRPRRRPPSHPSNALPSERHARSHSGCLPTHPLRTSRTDSDCCDDPDKAGSDCCDDRRSTAAQPTDPRRREEVRSDFAALLRAVLDGPEEDRPALLASRVDTVLEFMSVSAEDGGEGGLLEAAIWEEAARGGSRGEDGETGADRLDRVSAAVDEILGFVEAFVAQTSEADAEYKRVLGNIFQSIARSNEASSSSSVSPGTSSAVLEGRLDDLLSQESGAYTPGFLRHVEGECARTASLDPPTPESARMLEVLRLIQARVLEELGKGIGEGAAVLGSLLGYDDASERDAVLDAGLAVRGAEFAEELAGLTREALEGFAGVKERGGTVDPGLVEAVEGMDERIRSFIDRSNEAFQ